MYEYMAVSIDIYMERWYFMDVVQGDFVWDVHKEKLNILKHGVSFTVAAAVFLDPGRTVVVDEKHQVHEDRYFCMGEVSGRILTVRFTYRENRIRIIGAGYWRKGKEYYEKAHF
jgi:uncharacterized DUF497 family protein